MIVESQIVFLLSEAKNLVVRLNAETLLVGRRSESAIQIDEPSVSGRHAELSPLPDGTCRCRDLGSTNGTRVNGQPVQEETLLRDGDRVEFGAVAGIFQTDGESNHETAFGQPLPEAAIQARLVVGAILEGRYRLDQHLSAGGGYVVYRAQDTARDEPVSLRILPPALVRQREWFQRLQVNVGRLRAAPHPNLIALRDLSLWADRALLAAEWIEGVPLLDVLRRRHTLTLSEALSLLQHAAAAADHADAHGLLPLDFDLRPSLLAFADGYQPDPEQTQVLLAAPFEGWPAFDIKFAPRLNENDGRAAVPSGAPSSVAALAGLGCELLGHPLPGIYLGPGGIGRSKPKVIASLGEVGNRVLTRGLMGTEPFFPTHLAFVETLAASLPANL